MNIIEKFYQALQKADYKTMQSCYHPEATFYDPIFEDLNSSQVKAMWQMLCQRAENFSVEYRNLACDDNKGSCDWEADYTFSQTKKRVNNKIHSEFVLKDGLIFKQKDRFCVWRWSRQALGLTGWLLGWFPPFQHKMSSTARHRLEKFMESHQ
jgi:hypothetical protein